ncbi:MAG: DUF4384 domain-containing protein [Scytonema sp. RU_4_4]|nr:DUF4384 domain-containing protein [Scytonema sp. RU_4_4]
MASPQYNEYESQFLDSVADELGLVDESANFFKARVTRRFSESCAKTTQLVKDKTFLKTVFPSRHEEEDSKWLSSEAIYKLREVLRKIKKQNNWELGDKKIITWDDLIKFLRNDYFNKWLKIHEPKISPISFWEKLWNKVTSFTGIKISSLKEIGAEISTLEFNLEEIGLEQEDEMPTFPWSSELSYEINSQQHGYLTLIQKYSSEKLYLFSPSCLIKQPSQPAQNHRFPSSRLSFLPLKAGITGVDWVIAIISQNKPSLSCIQTEDQKPLQLKESDLQEFLNFLEQEPNCEVIGTKFKIIQPANSR